MLKEKKKKTISRKVFLRNFGLTIGGLAVGMNAKSYNRIIGANDRVRFAVIGANGRGQAHLVAISKLKNCSLDYLCDVDGRVLEKQIQKAKEITGNSVKPESDFRQILANRNVDAITIATPDHWHTPMAIMGLQAGRHVYVEKPLSHNPEEGEWLVREQEKHPDLVVQMGNQQRSSLTSIEAVQLIRDGLIGNAYYGKAWYANNRGPIGVGKVSSPPAGLNWELWQGPAPRVPYESVWVHYNWHWFWHWGTGEINNNGLHEMDFCRWALGLEYPSRVTSSGGRYAFQDDWQFYDTQVAGYEYGGKDGDDTKMISWEGRSCNPLRFYNRDRGSSIHGTKGTAIVDRGGYVFYNLKNTIIKERKEESFTATSTADRVGLDIMTIRHFENFVESVRCREKPHSPVREGHISTLMCHLGNIAQKTGSSLAINENSGQIRDNEEAMKMWSRTYEAGWKPVV